ncbi:MAG: hypothetical protein AAGD14_12830 [Planctomycetota bacterium]
MGSRGPARSLRRLSPFSVLPNSAARAWAELALALSCGLSVGEAVPFDPVRDALHEFDLGFELDSVKQAMLRRAERPAATFAALARRYESR